jgi:hypothetical protein
MSNDAAIMIAHRIISLGLEPKVVVVDDKRQVRTSSRTRRG